jgi:hypothetical protein
MNLVISKRIGREKTAVGKISQQRELRSFKRWIGEIVPNTDQGKMKQNHRIQRNKRQ